jgi:hypothetical protein
MSRVYRIRISETVTRTVHVKDGIERPIDLLGILPSDEMNELLRQQLETDGFNRQDNGSMVKDQNGVIIEIDPGERKIQASVAQSQKLSATVKQSQQSWGESRKEAKEMALSTAKAEANDQIQLEEKRLQEQVTEQLTDALGEIQRQIDQAINRATGEALKRRAAQLGEIEEINEDPETGSLQIRVKL